MEERETKGRTVKYVDIKKTRCGKCKHLKVVALTEALCLIHGVNPRTVPDFFGEACKDFEEL